LGNRAFIKTGGENPFSLTDVDSRGVQYVVNANASIIYTTKDSSARIKVIAPIRAELVIYTITSCTAMNQLTTINY